MRDKQTALLPEEYIKYQKVGLLNEQGEIVKPDLRKVPKVFRIAIKALKELGIIALKTNNR